MPNLAQMPGGLQMCMPAAIQPFSQSVLHQAPMPSLPGAHSMGATPLQPLGHPSAAFPQADTSMPWPLLSWHTQLGGLLAQSDNSALALATEPATPAVPAPSGHGKLPKYVSAMLPQQRPAGSIKAADLQWQRCPDKRSPGFVAAIPEGRLADFIDGEQLAGFTRLTVQQQRGSKHLCNSTEEAGGSKGVLLDLSCKCVYGCVQHTGARGGARNDQARKDMLPTDDLVPTQAGKKARKGGLQFGRSMKRDCQYRFTATQYHKVPDRVILSFPDRSDCTFEDCLSAQHRKALDATTNPGALAHEGEDMHIQHSDEVQQLAIQKLKEGFKPRVVRKGVCS